MKKFLLGLLVIVLVVAVGGFAVLGGSKKADVEWTEADFESYLAKGNITFSKDRASVEDIVTGNYRTVGSVRVDTTVSNAEITAILNKAAKDTGLLRDIRVKFRDDGRVEASAVIGSDLSMVYSRYPEAKKYESYLNTLKGKSVYMVGTLERVGNKKFEAYTEKAYVGLLPLPVDQTNDYLERVGTEINNIIGGMSGFSAEAFSFDSNGLYFKGTVPKEIKGTPWQ